MDRNTFLQPPYLPVFLSSSFFQNKKGPLEIRSLVDNIVQSTKFHQSYLRDSTLSSRSSSHFFTKFYPQFAFDEFVIYLTQLREND